MVTVVDKTVLNTGNLSGEEVSSVLATHARKDNHLRTLFISLPMVIASLCMFYQIIMLQNLDTYTAY